MVAKVNGGVFKDQVATGSLSAFVVTLTGIQKAISAGNVEWTLASGITRDYLTGDSVPDTAADYVARVITTRATIVSLELETDKMHVLLENAQGWTAATLQAAIDALATRNVSVATSDIANVSVDFTGNVVAQVRVLFDETATTVALGGGEHDQS